MSRKNIAFSVLYVITVWLVGVHQFDWTHVAPVALAVFGGVLCVSMFLWPPTDKDPRGVTPAGIVGSIGLVGVAIGFVLILVVLMAPLRINEWHFVYGTPDAHAIHGLLTDMGNAVQVAVLGFVPVFWSLHTTENK